MIDSVSYAMSSTVEVTKGLPCLPSHQKLRISPSHTYVFSMFLSSVTKIKIYNSGNLRFRQIKNILCRQILPASPQHPPPSLCVSSFLSFFLFLSHFDHFVSIFHFLLFSSVRSSQHTRGCSRIHVVTRVMLVSNRKRTRAAPPNSPLVSEYPEVHQPRSLSLDVSQSSQSRCSKVDSSPKAMTSIQVIAFSLTFTRRNISPRAARREKAPGPWW